MNFIYMAFLKKKIREDEITCIMSEIQQNIFDMKKLLDSYDVCQVCAYKYKTAASRKFPPKLTVFTSVHISSNRGTSIKLQLGALLEIRLKTEAYAIVSLQKKL